MAKKYYFVSQHISCIYTGVLTVDKMFGGKGDSESRYYIKKYLGVIKSLEMCYKPIDYVSRDMVSDLNATYYKIKQKIQSTIDDNIITFSRQSNHHDF